MILAARSSTASMRPQNDHCVDCAQNQLKQYDMLSVDAKSLPRESIVRATTRWLGRCAVSAG